MPIIATPGAATANSYNTLDGLEAYFDGRVDAGAWYEPSAQHEEAAKQGTLILDQYDYIGIPVTDTQALKWPRQLNEAGDLIRNYAINVIPAPIKNAHAEVVLWLLTEAGAGVAAGAVSSLKIGSSVEVKYGSESSIVNASTDPTGLPIQAARFLKGLRLIPVLA